ncbi:MAG: 2,3-bisphosphoglycerate-independent phosphoglycerate mutase [Deltaproteobacteria bacterium]|nr:2,3-bisphosphoglycerate-independent phosphoglycerate mutase [Deltaproteobacteria bacterium]
MNTHKISSCLLVILDGCGIGKSDENNAVFMAKTPFLDKIMTTCPHTRLACSGKAVGLPEKIMGNSEVGHLNIGAGRVVYQVLLRIDRAIADGSFFENPALTGALKKVKESGGALHFMGLLSDAGVHSQMRHLEALVDMAAKYGQKRVFIHVITDGRDTPPDSGVGFVRDLQANLARKGTGRIASICGRYYAMDRDTRWDRTEKSYRLYTGGEGVVEQDPVLAVKNAYARGETDEFIRPIILGPVILSNEDGTPGPVVSDRDAVIFFNFRPDRARQITRAFTDKNFDLFNRKILPRLSDYVSMTQYDEEFTLPVAFPPVHLSKILGEVISSNGLLQMRLAETEKYAHVTYFFNGGEEEPFDGEARALIPSPREVETYDAKPEMSAFLVADEAVRRLNMKKYHLMVINFANLDMVGHTGIMTAAIKACETVDECLTRVVNTAKENGYSVLVTADHGNAEQMKDANGNPHTAHTLNPVPLVFIGQDSTITGLCPGVLGDIAPTILDIMGIEQPPEMTGTSLIKR